MHGAVGNQLTVVHDAEHAFPEALADERPKTSVLNMITNVIPK